MRRYTAFQEFRQSVDMPIVMRRTAAAVVWRIKGPAAPFDLRPAYCPTLAVLAIIGLSV